MNPDPFARSKKALVGTLVCRFKGWLNGSGEAGLRAGGGVSAGWDRERTD